MQMPYTTTALAVIVVAPTIAAVGHYHMLKDVMYVLISLLYVPVRDFGQSSGTHFFCLLIIRLYNVNGLTSGKL